MSIQTKITCPDCGGDIHIDSVLLISGASFQCSSESCSTAISLAAKDVNKVSKAFNGFENLKSKSIQTAGSDPSNIFEL